MQYETVLLIDMGNSRIKVSFLHQPEIVVFVCEQLEELLLWLSSQTVSAIFCASVRDDKVVGELSAFCQIQSFPFSNIQTETHFAGLMNSYTDVSTMGIDRWLAMVACREFSKPNFAVLMFGTAITCDVVSNGKHQGGWIIPGRQLMQNALTSHTARVFSGNNDTSTLSLGNSTPECVSAGCLASAMGIVTMAERYLRTQYSEYCIFLTGGDNKVLTAVNEDAIFRAENLVLQGLARYAIAYQTNTMPK